MLVKAIFLHDFSLPGRTAASQLDTGLKNTLTCMAFNMDSFQ